MEQNLVIVESPAKAKTIEKFLGKDYLVKSCYGHIRDLSKSNLSIDLSNGYKPIYNVSPDKTQIVKELRELSKKASQVWLASDEDREGEAIAWHLATELKLDQSKTKRIVFHEITKNAILEAIKTPRTIDNNLVNAQQARRVLDRLVGYEVSPVLWKKVKPSLSAGRVQSVAVRLIVEREREIIAFRAISAYRVIALFTTKDNNGKEIRFKAELNKRFDTREQTLEFLEKCKEARFTVEDVVTKPAKKSPAPPFTTSTLQQEAGRKLGFSVARTMSVAQKLYESGKITYMRTDSVNLSSLAINTAKTKIINEFGEKYHQIRNYKTKTKGAQEAHEAIRPTYMENETISGTEQEKKLYDLIWKRTIASQMADALLEKTQAGISISTTSEKFIASGEVILFDGFLKVYTESDDDETEENDSASLPPLKTNDNLTSKEIQATEKYTHHPPRYSEASLVKKMEELGIGRPSTYAPTISTVQQRGYVVRESRDGQKRKYRQLTLTGKTIKTEEKQEVTGAEKQKLFPTDIGMVVTDFLKEHFTNILSYDFTAKVEKQFDEIAEGKLNWEKMIHSFYEPFHKTVEETTEKSQRESGERLLGNDPVSQKPVYARIGRFGPVAQIGEKDDPEKPRYASLRKNQHIESITLEDALELFKLPRELGQYHDKKVSVGIGRFGPYVKHENLFVSLKADTDDPYSIDLDRAIELIEQKKLADAQKTIKTFDQNPEIKVLNGRFGPYIACNKQNYKIPKGTNPQEITLEKCLELIAAADSKKAPEGKSKSAAKTKNTTAKKKTTKTEKKTAPKTQTKKSKSS